MKRLIASVTVLSLILLVTSLSMALGQEAATTPDSLETDYIVGNWSVEGTLHGKPVTGSMQVRPGPGGVCLIFKWSIGPSQEGMVHGFALGGRDPETSGFLEYCFETDGSHFFSRYPGEAFPDTGVGHGERTGIIHGKPYQGKITVDRRGRDHFIYTVVSEQGEDEKLTFRRVPDEQTVSPVYEHLKNLEDFIGEWIAEETLDQDLPGIARKGDTVTYRASISWTQNKSIMQIDFTTSTKDGTADNARWLFGWDASNGQIVYSGFNTGGGRVWGSLNKEEPNKWLWKNNWVESDGTQLTMTDTMTMLDNNSTHVHELRMIVDGPPQPERKLIYKRVK